MIREPENPGTAPCATRRRTARTPAGAAGAGFTLVELLVSSLIAVALIVAILTIFELNSRVARVQTQVADLQQSVRVAQYDLARLTRMSGRGGLPAALMPAPLVVPPFAGKILPNGVALEIENDVPDGTTIAGAGTPAVLAETDILTLRGVFTQPIYQIDPTDFDLGGRTVSVNSLSPAGVPQDLQPLADAVTDAIGGDPDALVLVSPLAPGLYGVAELSGGVVQTGTVGGSQVPVRVTLNFALSGGVRTDSYQGISPEGRFPPQITSAAFVGLLEEYRYYIRENRAIPGDPASDLMPRLSRARFYPFTDTVHPSNPSAQEDIADNVLDLQVSLGIDRNQDGVITEGTDEPTRNDDEWLFNSPGDRPDDPLSLPAGWVWNGPTIPLFYVRINTLARTDRRDTRYVAPPIARIEDRVYGEPEVPGDETQRRDRMYRRRQLQTTIDLRNL